MRGPKGEERRSSGESVYFRSSLSGEVSGDDSEFEFDDDAPIDCEVARSVAYRVSRLVDSSL